MYVLLISYVAAEQLITPMKAQLRVALATSLPSSTVDQSTGEGNIITAKFCVCYQYINSDSDFDKFQVNNSSHTKGTTVLFV